MDVSKSEPQSVPPLPSNWLHYQKEKKKSVDKPTLSHLMLILSHNYYFLQKCFTVHIRQSDTYSRMPSVNCCIYQQAEWVDWEEEVKNKTPFLFFFFASLRKSSAVATEE